MIDYTRLTVWLSVILVCLSFWGMVLTLMQKDNSKKDTVSMTQNAGEYRKIIEYYTDPLTGARREKISYKYVPASTLLTD